MREPPLNNKCKRAHQNENGDVKSNQIKTKSKSKRKAKTNTTPFVNNIRIMNFNASDHDNNNNEQANGGCNDSRNDDVIVFKS